MTGNEVFCVGWQTVMGNLRIVTYPSIFRRPLTQEQAPRNVEALLSAARCRVLSEDEGSWAAYRRVAAEVPVRGNLVPDAHLAAPLRQHGIVTVHTHDRGSRRFSFLTVKDPLA